MNTLLFSSCILKIDSNYSKYLLTAYSVRHCAEGLTCIILSRLYTVYNSAIINVYFSDKKTKAWIFLKATQVVTGARL